MHEDVPARPAKMKGDARANAPAASCDEDTVHVIAPRSFEVPGRVPGRGDVDRRAAREYKPPHMETLLWRPFRAFSALPA
jgi:hypothetical protein